MKRILSLVLGTLIGIVIIYVLRRLLTRTTPAQQPADSQPTRPNTTETNTKQETPIGRFTVRTTGPRPQVPSSNGSGKISEIEPIAAQETDNQTASGSASMEAQAELALAATSDMATANPLPTVMPEPNVEKLEAKLAQSDGSDVTETDAKTSHETQSPEATDDLIRIKGIGEVTAQKLQAAGVSTFAQLATMTPEEIEEKIGFSAARVQHNKIIEQAQALAKGEELVFEETK